MSATHFSFGRGRREVALQEVAGPLDRGLVRDRRAVLAAAQLAFEPVLAHHAGDPVAADVDVAAAQLLPGLAGAVDAPVALAGGLDLRDAARGRRARGGTASGICARSACSPARRSRGRSARPRRHPAAPRRSGSPSPGRVELRARNRRTRPSRSRSPGAARSSPCAAASALRAPRSSADHAGGR